MEEEKKDSSKKTNTISSRIDKYVGQQSTFKTTSLKFTKMQEDNDTEIQTVELAGNVVKSDQVIDDETGDN